MFIGIEKNTDVNNPDTKIKKFQTESSAQKWLDSWDTPYAYPGAADESIPASQQNWHRRIRSVVEMPQNFRLSKKEVMEEYRFWRDSSHHKSDNDYKTTIYRRHSIREL